MNQKEHLQNIFKLKPSGFDPYVEKHRETSNGLSYGSWKKYAQQDQVDERSVLPNEIVIDIDAETTEECRKENKQVCRLLDNQGLPYFVADTGGTGFHIHIFFQIPDNKDNIGSYRQALYDWLKQEAKENTQVNTALWDDGVVEFDSELNNGHLVRAVGGRKTSTGHRKTVVLSSTLDKEQVEEPDQVEYPALNPRHDFWKINKLDSSDADLSWTEVNQAAEQIHEEKEERRTQKLESNYEADDDGIQALREIPAHEVLKQFFDLEAQPGEMVRCVVHDSEDLDAKVTDGSETNVPEGRYGCFGDSCTEKGETIHWYNSIDLLTEGKDLDFKQAKEKLAEEFDVEIEEADEEMSVDNYCADDFMTEDGRNNSKWDYHHLADVIQDFVNFKYISEDDTDQLFIQEEGIWKEKGESTVTNLCMELTNEEMYSQKAIKQVKQIIKNRSRIYKEENFFDPPERLVPFQNGVYDVEKDKFRDYDEDDNFRFKHEVEFIKNPEEKQDNGKVEDFLDSIQDTERKKEILKEVTALALLPDFPIDKAPVLYGEGSNGKNKFVELLEKISGTYHKINMEDFTGDDHASAELENTTLVFFDEFQHISNPGKVKEFIGSNQTRVRHMHQTGYMTKQIATPVLAANELPTPPEQKISFFRRWEIIDFPYRFTADQDDGYKNMLNDEEIKERYWTDEALNCFASKAVRKLGDFIERQDFTDGRSPEETKHIWNNKSNPVYTFLDTFVEQGNLPNQGTETTADCIVKEKILDMVNDYLDIVNGGTVKKGKLTAAIKGSVDIEKGVDQQKEIAPGKTKMAYSGLRLTLPDFDDYGEIGHLDSSRVRELLREYWDVFSDLSSSKDAHIPIIVKIDLHREALLFLQNCQEKKAPLLEVIKALDLEEGDIEELMDCDYINVISSIDTNSRFPVIEFDEESFDQAVEESDALISDEQSYKGVSEWVGDKVDELTANQQVQMDEYFIEPGKEKGYSEEKIEEEVKSRVSNAGLYEPVPGKIEVM